MSRLDVVMLLKEALRRQQFDHDNFQLVRSEVASYLTSRYSQKSAASQEANQFREIRHENLKQKLTEKKQLATPIVTSNNQRTRPKTLLHVLANYRAQVRSPEEAKFPLLRQFSQKTEEKELQKASSEPSLPTPKSADDTGEEKLTALSSQLLRKAMRAPWSTFRSSSEPPAVTSDNMNPTTEMKKLEKTRANLRIVAAKSTKLSALGEATLRAVKERKEKKERALAIAKMEARQAKIEELKARAEAALNRAKEVLSGLA